MSKTVKVEVLVSHIKHNRKFCQPGDIIEVTEAAAADMVSRDEVKAVDKAAKTTTKGSKEEK